MGPGGRGAGECTDFSCLFPQEGIEMTSAALRWILHHSALSEESGDALIVGKLRRV